MGAEVSIPNLRHLLGAVAVADQGTLSRAAQEINLSQPALTQGIAKIEQELGVLLFRRSGGGMHPTDAGSLFIARTRRGFEFLRRADRIAGKPYFHHQITLGQLRSLVATVDAGGFREAAIQLGRDASTVSRACREIELQFEIALFENTSSGLKPTRSGEALTRNAKLALREFGQAVYDVRGLQGDFEGRLSIGCLPLAQSSILPRALNLFAGEYPRVICRVVDGYYTPLARGLLRGDLDLLIGALRHEELPNGLVQERLFDDSLSVVARVGHPLTHRRNITMEEVAGYPWVAPRMGAPSRSYFDQMLDTRRVPASVPAPIETGSHSVLKGILFNSDRLALLSKRQAAQDFEAKLLTRIDITLPDSGRAIGMTWREDWLPGPPQERFLNILREVSGKSEREKD
ncbi:MAG: LysR family transcriptional regulator [Limibacillus sp.]